MLTTIADYQQAMHGHPFSYGTTTRWYSLPPTACLQVVVVYRIERQ